MKAIPLGTFLAFTTFHVVFAVVAPTNSSSVACRTLSNDPSWPALSVWRAAMPEVEKQASNGLKKHPNYRLDATTVDEVIAAVKFAAKYNIRLSLLNSGHDFHGRNDAPNGLSLVLTGLKGVRILSQYTPTSEGMPAVNSSTKTNLLPEQAGQAYVTFGAGFSTQQLNNEIARSNLFALGAAHGEVTVAGGWGQTGGHSPLSPRYGLGVDQPVEYKVVTADGALKIANSVSNPDLFWALRGGGGGTFGVVVEATVKAYPSPKVATSQFWINTTDFKDAKSIYPATAWLHAQFPEWQEKGISAFYYVYPNAFSLYAMNSGAEGTMAWMDTNWKPVLQKLGTFPGLNSSSMSYRSREYPNYKSFFDATWGPIDKKMAIKRGLKAEKIDQSMLGTLYRRHGPGEMEMATQSKGIAPMDSWLLGVEHLKSPKLAQALEDAMPKLQGGEFRGQFIGGGKVLQLGNDTSAHPAWRRTYAHIVLVGVGQPDATAFRRFAPDMGAYVNEASYLTPGWKDAFWGPNYDRLSQIKQKYDPDHLFWVTPGIDADAWTFQDGRLCRTTGGLKTVNKAAEIAPANDNPNFVDQVKDDETRGAAFPLIQGPDGPVPNPFYPATLASTVQGLGKGL